MQEFLELVASGKVEYLTLENGDYTYYFSPSVLAKSVITITTHE